jgi:hypothetical protein
MRHRLAGLALAAGLLLVPVAPALAGPTVTVRVEGQDATLLPATTVTLGDTDITLADGSTCPANSAGAALDAATAGNWDRMQFVSTILGESHTFTANDYWAEWVNNRYGGGLCADRLVTGDKVLLLVDTSAATTGAPTVFALDLADVPAAVNAGTPFSVAVTQYLTDGNPGTGTPQPAPGVTVTAGGASATTGPDGRAVLAVPAAGATTIRAARGTARSAAQPLNVAPAGAAVAVAGVTVDRTKPRARLLSPRTGHTYRVATFSPRLIHVAVAESGSGVRAVKLRLAHRVGDRCFSYSGSRERFIAGRCGAGFYFTVSNKSDFTYLLPERLGRGHYVLDALAIDNAFNRDGARQRGRNRSVFDVR